MIKNLEENSQILQKTADESAAKLRSYQKINRPPQVNAPQKTAARGAVHKNDGRKPLSKPSE